MRKFAHPSQIFQLYWKIRGNKRDSIYNEPYSLLIRASYFISFSVHARFTSVLLIDCKWRWWCRSRCRYLRVSLNSSYFNVLHRSYRVNNKVIDVLYILLYYYTGILFVVLRKGWVSYTSLFAGNLP